MTYRVEIGEVHENGLSVAFSIYDDQDDAGEPSWEGYVKWDGCVNWQTDTGCMAHFCCPEDIDAFAATFRTVWDLARPYFAGREDESYGK
jgi:hypothetical protein